MSNKSKKIQLQLRIENILWSDMNGFNGVEMIIEETLDFLEPYKDVTAQI